MRTSGRQSLESLKCRMPSTISSFAPGPCTFTGYRRISTFGNRRVNTVHMSWITAPAGDVTMAMRCGRNGRGRFLPESNSPSFSSFSFSALYCAIRSPSPAILAASTTIWYAPRGA